MDDACGWCGTRSWDYRCSTCDPRKEKKLCLSCSTLWHSRGFARGHKLTSRLGISRSFLAWGSPGTQSNGDTNSVKTETNPTAVASSAAVASTARSSEAQAAAAPAKAADDTLDAPTEKPSEVARPAAEAKKDTGIADRAKQEEEEEEEPMEEEFEFEMVGESVDSGEDEDTASVENDRELEERKKAVTPEEALTSKCSRAGSSTSASDSAAPIMEPQVVANGNQASKDKSAAIATTPTLGISSASVPAPTSSSVARQSSITAPAPDAAASIALTTPAFAARTQTSTATSTQASHSPADRTPISSRREVTTLQPKPVDLEKLLRWFPTADQVLIEMLSTRIEAALVVEDALICARIGKCEETACRSVLLHYEHCKRNQMCGDSKCSEISIVYRHRRACLKKDAAPTIDGKTFVCPFCIRIRQRRSLGVVVALDHLISDQRRALQSAHSEASRNFCLQSINTWTRRKQVLHAETDRLNKLASESSVPIFNFPRYQWHFSDTVLIKREPTPVETREDTTTESTATGSSADETNMVQANEQSSSSREDEHIATRDVAMNNHQSQNAQADSMPGNANFNADFINELLQAKAEHGDGREVAQREFGGVMELGYAIVDASFCAPAKAQRCLLNCKSILVHLQHHLDLQVCTQAMCTAVEHHFAHLSQCKARGESESCEYCLRVEERQHVRSVDFMEAELPEAEAKIQKVINDITASFTNHRPDEREQEVIQLEDELEQAEDNKRELFDKLSVARHSLRKVRKTLEHRGMSTSGSRRLPLHFVKVRRGDSSGNNLKRRRLQN